VWGTLFLKPIEIRKVLSGLTLYRIFCRSPRLCFVCQGASTTPFPLGSEGMNETSRRPS